MFSKSAWVIVEMSQEQEMDLDVVAHCLIVGFLSVSVAVACNALVRIRI